MHFRFYSVQKFLAASNNDFSLQGRNEVYGIRDQRPKKGWDPGSQPQDLGSLPPGSGSAVFSLDQGSGAKFWITKGIHDTHLNRVL